MCGIAGSFFKYDQALEEIVSLDTLFATIAQAESEQLKATNLLDLVWKLKSNANFLAFCRSKDRKAAYKTANLKINRITTSLERQVQGLGDMIDLEGHKKLTDCLESLRDASWFLSHELPEWEKGIAKLSETCVSEMSDETLLLYLTIHKVINAIDNRLEIRGRDSMGLAIMLNSRSFSELSVSEINDNSSPVKCQFVSNQSQDCYLFSFRHCCNIGELGENATAIKNLIKFCKSFSQIAESGKIETASIVAHTRWASVGAINLQNTLPLQVDIGQHVTSSRRLISSTLNGDIHNYKDIISSTPKGDISKIFNGPPSTSDAVSIPLALAQLNCESSENPTGLLEKLEGSFVICLQDSERPDTVHLMKKGAQGLYLGLSTDGLMFASDLYGLVENSRQFISVPTEVSVLLSADTNPDLESGCVKFFDHESNELSSFSSDSFSLTNITTRDIAKLTYEHFLEKEIYETPEIISKTLNLLIQDHDKIGGKFREPEILIDESQVPAEITEDLVSGKINKIIITGMGTCYTAAVAISYFMRARLKLLRKNLLVEPHIATEGSAFYLEPSMENALVIVIAQSGTTVDTNVFARMAKERGARTLALANKRDGDITFLVDGCLYIGNGRDIEIAVPSTKTFTAHVFLGYILALFIGKRLANSKAQSSQIDQDLVSLIDSKNLISESLVYLESENFEETIYKQASRTNSWVVAYDDSSNSACAQEIRIKFSESCYQSIGTLTIEETLRLNLKNSFIIILSEKKIRDLEESFNKMLLRKNKILFIANGPQSKSVLRNSHQNGDILVFEMPSSKSMFSFIPSVIAGQILSYRLALALDRRKDYFSRLFETQSKPTDLQNATSRLQRAFDSGEFTQGFNFEEIRRLNALLKTLKTAPQKVTQRKLQEQLRYYREQTRRTIDTVKHQAKTITVGAVRQISNQQNISLHFLSEQSQIRKSVGYLGASFAFDAIMDSLKSWYTDEAHEILVFAPSIDEAFAYNIVNFVNENLKTCGINTQLRLCRPYDLTDIDHNLKMRFLYLRRFRDECLSPKISEYLLNNCITFCFETWHKDEKIFSKLLRKFYDYQDVKLAYWSLDLAVCLTRAFVSLNNATTNATKLVNLIERQSALLTEGMAFVYDSDRFKSSIYYGAECFATRSSWKSIGSGTNYNTAKYVARHLTHLTSRSCAFDVLENHKHIDMSAESAIITLIAHIRDPRYQNDAYGEIEKIVAHKSLPIVFTNDNDRRFEELRVESKQNGVAKKNIRLPVVNLPLIDDKFAMPLNVLAVSLFGTAIKNRLAQLSQNKFL